MSPLHDACPNSVVPLKLVDFTATTFFIYKPENAPQGFLRWLSILKLFRCRYNTKILILIHFVNICYLFQTSNKDQESVSVRSILLSLTPLDCAVVTVFQKSFCIYAEVF